MTKELDFWTLLRAWNNYDHWLSNKLCSFGPNYDGHDERYKVYAECRHILKDILDEVLKWDD